jgi:hypothetical protein
MILGEGVSDINELRCELPNSLAKYVYIRPADQYGVFGS